MDNKEKKLLLSLARESVMATVCSKEFVLDSTARLPQEKRGCFVTLKTNSKLRGCLGFFVSDEPLYKTVIKLASDAATSDPRFYDNRLREDELDALEIEISVLSELVKTDDPLSLRLGVDGIYIRSGFQSGCFLPQVATEANWNAQEFLSYCCSHKANLAPDAWKDPSVEVLLFTADVFSEKDFA